MNSCIISDLGFLIPSRGEWSPALHQIGKTMLSKSHILLKSLMFRMDATGCPEDSGTNMDLNVDAEICRIL